MFNAWFFGTKSRTRRFFKSVAIVCCLFVVLALVVWMCIEIALRLTPPLDIDSLYGSNTSSTLFDRNGRILRSYLAPDERWRIPVTKTDVSPWLISATLAAEDKRFWQHGGIDFVAFVRAFRTNLSRGKIVSGASTLTMQAAMLDQQKEGRTIKWKLHQIWRALRLERQLSKDEILMLYLSNAPYGGNIHGVEAAAYRYFGVSAKELTLSESALLAGIPQSPTRLRPDRHLTTSLTRRNMILDLMCRQGTIDADESERAKAYTPTITRSPLPRRAPHFTDFVHALYPRTTRLKTTLDLDIQQLAEERLQASVEKLLPRGVTNGSVVVMENSTGNVLAMVGSVNYDSKASGQVNGAFAVRSPGSTLKPLIYGYAFDEGLVLPQTVLADVPVSWVGYIPENFFRRYQGLVRADKALAWSLNIPAIEVLQTIGVPRMIGFLRSIGFGTLSDKTDKYGLSLAIGSCGVRLLDLTNAYTMLSRGGEWKPWRICSDDSVSSSVYERGTWIADESGKFSAAVGLKHPGSSWFVLRALSDPTLRQPEEVAPVLYGLKNVAWKTGTSSDFRDAWTVAICRDYTIGVWLGNFDGKPSRVLVGSEVAAPLALGLAQALQKKSASVVGEWPVKPLNGLKPIRICAESGLPVNRDLCPSTVTADVLVDTDGKTLLLPSACAVHRKIPVDAATGYEVCEQCMSGKDIRMQSVAFWPVDITAFLKKRGIDSRPPHTADCKTRHREENPRIISPVPNGQYLEDKTRAANMQKMALKASIPPGASYLWWFANDALIAHGPPETDLWWNPTVGNYVIRVTDDKGRADKVNITVERVE